MAKASKTRTTGTTEIKSAELLNKYIENQIQNSKDLQKSVDEVADSYTDLAAVLQGIVKNSKVFGEEWDDVEDISKTLLRNLESIGSEYYEHVDTQKQLLQIQDKKDKLLNDAIKYENEISEAASLNLIKRKEIAEARLSEVKYAQELADTAEEHIIALTAQLDVINRAHEVAKEMGIDVKQISKEITAPFEKIMSFLEEVPGGGILSKFLGIDGKMEELSKKVLSTFVTKLGETGSVGAASLGALRAGATAFMASLGPILVPLFTVRAALYAI